MALTDSMEIQALREYEAKCSTVTNLLDRILTSDNLAFTKEIAFEAREILQHGL